MHTSEFLNPPNSARTCYTCHWWRATRGRAVECGPRPPASGAWLVAQPERGCAFWEREPGSDDETPGS